MASQETPFHLANAARTLERILNRRDPEHVYTVHVGPVAGTKLARLKAGGDDAGEES